MTDLDLINGYIDRPKELIFDLWHDYFIETHGDNPNKWIDNWLVEILDALSHGHQYIAVTGANAVGKTAGAVMIMYAFLASRYQALVPVTSVSQPHLRSIFWAEARRWYNRAPEIQRTFEYSATFIRNQEEPDIWFAEARTARKQGDADTGKAAVGLQGYHSEHLLYILDEGSGVDDVNYEAAESSIRKPDQHLLAISNPLRVHGRMFDVFHLEKYKNFWFTKAVSYKESSQIDQVLAEAQIKMLGGESNPVVQVRYLGRFPTRGSPNIKPTYDEVLAAVKRTFITDMMAVQTLISAYLKHQPGLNCGYTIEQLQEFENLLALQKKFTRPVLDYDVLYSSSMLGRGEIRDRWESLRRAYWSGECRLGVDLARFGADEITFCVRRGWRVLELEGFHGLLQPDILGRIKNYFERFGCDIAIIDATGIAAGFGVIDPLMNEDNGNKYPCIEIAFGAASTDPDKYKNLATQMWMYLAENIDKLLLPDDDILLSQLSTRRYEYTGKTASQLVIESKEKLAGPNRGLPSPDRADALCLAFAEVEIYNEDDDHEGGSYSDIQEPDEEGVFNL